MLKSLATTNYSSWNYTLPFPPSVNTYWRRQGNRYFVGKAGVKFQKAVASCVKHKPNTRRRLAVTIQYQRGDDKSYDIDNYAKAVLDALAHAGVLQDDGQVDELHQYRRPVHNIAKCVVTVQEIGPAKTVVKV